MSAMQPEVEETTRDIAVIGMAGRFPGANTIAAFWENLCNGIESSVEFTDQELLLAGVREKLIRSPKYVRKGFVLDDIAHFDHTFFGFSKGDAEILDPQQRLFLEIAWESLENAGYDPDRFPGLIAVYAGMGTNAYLLKKFNADVNRNGSITDFQYFLMNEKDFLATRVSYKLNLKGPSLTIQTGCSTALVCIHYASLSLLNYECDMALAGGVSITIPQTVGYLHQMGMLASPDGSCRAFDKAARGFSNGNGAIAVILKRLDDAIADKDHIYAVVKGSAINNDGAAKVGYSAPSIDGQAEVIAEALAVADIDPDTIAYVETHGAGTPLGDPIEIQALTKAFSAHTTRKAFCGIGSVKTNIGHLNVAAGAAGFVKTVLSIDNGAIPPSLHFTTPNPQIPFDETPFYVNTALREWPETGTKRRAGVSSFGIGGTNAHAILEEAPSSPRSGNKRSWHLLVLSARTETALSAIKKNLARHLQHTPGLELADVAYTLQVGRKQFEHIQALPCQNIDDAVTKLTASANGYFSDGAKYPVTFTFGGQWDAASLWTDLPDTDFEFKTVLNDAAMLLQSHLKERSTVYHSFITEYATAEMWLSWGVQPAHLLGSHLGILIAACIADMISLSDVFEALNVFERLGIKEGSHASLKQKSAMDDVCMHLCRLPWKAPSTDVFSHRGKQLTLKSAADDDFWREHLEYACISAETNSEALAEITPIILSMGTIQPVPSRPDSRTFVSFSVTANIHTCHEHFIKTLGDLWIAGADIDWECYYHGYRHHRVPLPTYPFEREYCWFEED